MNISSSFRTHLTQDNNNLEIRAFSDEINLCIYEKNEQLFKVSINNKSTVSQLNKIIRRRIKPKSNLLCLSTLKGKQIVDYLLQIPQQALNFLKNNQKLFLVLQGQLKDYSRPSTQDFYFIKCLGQGGSASVFLVRHRMTGKLYALKQIEKGYFVQFKRMEQVLRQKKIMAQILVDFPFAAQLYASFQSQKHLNFVLEFYPGGQLFFHLQQKRFTQDQARLYFCQMIIIFQHLHKNKIVYRDLKPQNILIDMNGHSRLSDFGLCKLNLSKDDLTNSYCGSVQYMAPQVKNSIGYNYSVDFYALGAFLYEMVVGVPPYYKNQPLVFPTTCSKQFVSLVHGLIQEEMSSRISSFQKIKQSSWLRGIDWTKVYGKEYRMPLKIYPYNSYIHQEFKDVPVYEKNHFKQNKYDKLFEFFYFVKHDNNGLSEIYLTNRGFKKNKSIKVTSASNSVRKKKETSASSKQSVGSVGSVGNVGTIKQKLRKINCHSNDSRNSRDSKDTLKRDIVRRDTNKIQSIYTAIKKRDQVDRFPLQFRQISPNEKKVINFKRATIKHVRSNQILPKGVSLSKKV